jgi:hypothetical protein
MRTHNLTILTKTKENDPLLRIVCIRWQKSLSTHVSNDVTHVSVPVEDGSQQSASLTHALKGPALSCPLMHLADQYFHTHSISYKLSTNTKLS